MVESTFMVLYHGNVNVLTYLRFPIDNHFQGANFRDLPGVVVGRDNVARRDLTEKQLVLPSGKPLVSADAL